MNRKVLRKLHDDLRAIGREIRELRRKPALSVDETTRFVELINREQDVESEIDRREDAEELTPRMVHAIAHQLGIRPRHEARMA